MNLLARILSHGFAFAVVAIIVIVLMYRGEFSPGWELPEFLVIQKQPGTTAEADSGAVERTAREASMPADSSATTIEPPAQAPLAPEPAPATSGDAAPAGAPGSPEETEELLAPAPAPAASGDALPEMAPEAPDEAEEPLAPEPAPAAVAPELPDEPTTAGEMDVTSDVTSIEGDSAVEMPAAGEAEDIASDSSSAPVTAPGDTAEAIDETSTTEPAAGTGSSDQATEDATVPA